VLHTAPLDHCLVTGQVSKHVKFSFQPISRIFGQKLIVFPIQEFSTFGLLQSRLPVRWTWFLSSTMKTDINYSPTDFPFPEAPQMAPDSELEQAAGFNTAAITSRK
jgi:hypothetical protein